MKLRNIFALILAVMTAILLTACSSTSGSADLQPMTVGIMPDLDSIPFVVAEQQGWLPDRVTLEIFRSPVDRDSALFSNNLDGTISDILAVALAQNGDFEAYATSKTNGRYGVLVAEDSEVKTADQLEGKEIGLSVNTIIEYVADRVVSQKGGDPAKVVKVAVPKIPSRLELLENNQIDAIAVPEPYVTAAAANGATILNTSDELGINPAVMLFTGDAVKNKNKELKRLYEAYDKAVDYINNTEPSEFMPGVIEYLGLPEDAIDVVLPVYEKMTLPSETEIEQAVSWLFDKKLIDKEFGYDELVREIK